MSHSVRETRTARSPWFTGTSPRAGVAFRLFCFPFAGGGASVFRTWGARVGTHIDICAMQPPGREERYHDAPFTDAVALASAAATAMQPHLDVSYALFGHSMGALVAFEVARALEALGAPPPRFLALSAYPAPHLATTRRQFHHLPTPALIEELKRLQGTPQAALDNPELMAFVLPTLRADFAVCDTYAYREARALALPLFVYGGQDDTDVSPSALDAWGAHTTGDVVRATLPGGHFFLQTHRDQFLDQLAAAIATTAPPHRMGTTS